MQNLTVQNAVALGVVAAADVARSVWVMDAVLDPASSMSLHPWLATGLILATGGISVAMLGLAARAVLDRAHVAVERPSS